MKGGNLLSRKISINGIVTVQDTVDDDEFLKRFIKFVEFNEWEFFGHTYEDSEDTTTEKLLKHITEEL